MPPHNPAPPQSRRPAAPRHPPAARDPGAALRRAWSALRSAEEARRLLQLCGTTAPGAYRQVGAPFAQAVPAVSAHDLLAGAAQGGLRLAIAVGSAAHPHYVGELRDARIAGDCLWVRGDGFELRLPEAAIAQALIVRRPSRTGLTQTLELFDAADAALVSLASDAGPCGPQRCDWRLLINTVAAQADPCVS